MSERIRQDRLDAFIAVARTDVEHDAWNTALPSNECLDALAELQERRAADLTAEEREALAWARKLLSRSPLGPTMRPRAIATIDKLTSKPGGE